MQPSNYRIAGRLKYVEGDSSIPTAAGHRIIINFCNADGVWRKESEPLEKRWSALKQDYVRWHRSQDKFTLGELNVLNVQSDTSLINALVYDDNNISEEPATKCLDSVGNLAVEYGSSVHINYTNDWSNLEHQLIEKIIKRGINVTIYGKE